MSENSGNTGQRYSQSHITSVKLHGGDIVIGLECGHGYSYTPTFDTEKAYFLAKQRMLQGARARCNQCKAVSR